jgi:hypothetical protein
MPLLCVRTIFISTITMVERLWLRQCKFKEMIGVSLSADETRGKHTPEIIELTQEIREYAASSRERGVSVVVLLLPLLSPPIWLQVTLTCS